MLEGNPAKRLFLTFAASQSSLPGETKANRKMKWFRRKKKSQSVDDSYNRNSRNNQRNNHNSPFRFDPAGYPTTTSTANCIARLPAPLLERVFAFVCPHARDETYETCELSAVEDTCMLCDLRDLAHCAQVSRRWRKLAANVL